MLSTLTGNNSFLLKAELDKLVTTFVAEHGDLALERIDGEEAEYDRIRESLESMPFLASKKLVVLRAPSANKQFLEKAEALLANISEITDVIIHEPKLDKRTAYAKYLQKNTEYKEFSELDAPSLARWLCEEAKRSGGDLSIADANYLVRRIGPKQQLLANELKKLLIMGTPIDRKLIDNLTEPTPQSSVFDLLESAFGGNYRRVMELYEEQRSQNIEPQQIIALLAWQLHVLAVCVWSGGKNSGEIAREAKLNPYVVQKTMGLARDLTKSQVKSYTHKLLELDEAIKTSAVQVDDALQAYLLGLRTISL